MLKHRIWMRYIGNSPTREWERDKFDPYRFGVYMNNIEGSNPYYSIDQSTGIYDSNGIEIFEGDILNCRIVDETVDMDMSLYKLVEDVSTFLLNWGKFNFYHGDFTSITIEGNEYENPELLDKVQEFEEFTGESFWG